MFQVMLHQKKWDQVGIILRTFNPKIAFNPLGSPSLSLLTVTLTNIWKFTPFYFLILLAGLQAIDDGLYEAARMDGASGWRQFCDVTLPLMKNYIITLAVFDFVSTAAYMDLTWIMTKGGPLNSSEVLSTLAYRTSFQNFRFGEGSAVGVLIFLISIIFTTMAMKMMSECKAMDEKKQRQRILVGTAFGLPVIYRFAAVFVMLLSSFRASNDPFTNSVLPGQLTLSNYANIFRNTNMLRPFFNSLVVAVGATVITMILSLLAAYGFSRYYFKGREFLLSFLVNLRTFPALLLAIALYVMAVKAGLYNTYIPLILANTMMNLPFAIWNVKTVIDGVPKDLEESAMVDGLSRSAVIWKIIVPVATPGLAATAIYVFILTWNEYLFATTFMNSNDMQLVTAVIASAVTQFGVDYGWLMTTAMLASIPAIIMFIAIQRFIVGGLTAGGIKG